MQRRCLGTMWSWVVMAIAGWLVATGLVAQAGAQDDSRQGGASAPDRLLVLGPLPSPPTQVSGADAGPLTPPLLPLPELDAARLLPTEGDQVVLDPSGAAVWTARETVVDRAGSGQESRALVHLERPGVYWASSWLWLDRWSELKLELLGGDQSKMWVDAEPVACRGDGDGSCTARVGLARGAHLLVMRIGSVSDEAETPALGAQATALNGASIEWSLDPSRAVAHLDEALAPTTIGALAIDLKGERIAQQLRFYEPWASSASKRVELLDSNGNVIMPSIGDGKAQPVAFSPDGERLLLKEERADTTDVMVLDIASGLLRTVIEDEPGLQQLRWGPGGTHLLLISSKGAPERVTADDAARRRAALREKLIDYEPERHLHLVDVESGARRRLTAPGDWVIDDAAFVTARQAVVYARAVPIQARPWFTTELRLVNLVSGEDQLLSTFQAGWESRPRALSAAPRGQRVAFVGPPEQVGLGAPEHNTFQTAVHLLDLDSGEISRISPGTAYAFDPEHGRQVAWSSDERQLLVPIVDGSRRGIARLSDGGGEQWSIERFAELRCESATKVAFSGDRERAVFAASSRNLLPRAHLLTVASQEVSVISMPNTGLEQIWRLAPVEDAAFDGPGGQRIDAWWYRPSLAEGERGAERAPLIVAYYGGAKPISRRFSSSHQRLAANGYAVLVVNPRGAIGYGQELADAHVNDWGPKASADILAGIDAFLEAHGEIVDAERIGIFGGSYGGFMTAYLLSASDRFAAAVSLYGISDLASYWGDGAWGYTYSDVASAGSFPWNAPELYARRSPLYRADRIDTPLLLLHGEDDRNVPPSESEQLFTALAVQGKEVELVLFPGEDHGIWASSEHRDAHRTMIVEWFDRFLRDQPGAWQARWAR